MKFLQHCQWCCVWCLCLRQLWMSVPPVRKVRLSVFALLSTVQSFSARSNQFEAVTAPHTMLAVQMSVRVFVCVCVCVGGKLQGACARGFWKPLEWLTHRGRSWDLSLSLSLSFSLQLLQIQYKHNNNNNNNWMWGCRIPAFVQNDDKDKSEEVLIKDRTDSKVVLRNINTIGVRIRELYISVYHGKNISLQ